MLTYQLHADLCNSRVRLKDLLRATSRLLPRYYLRIPWRLLGVRRDGIRNMQLHPAFARTMRLAQVTPAAACKPSLCSVLSRLL